MIFSSNTIKFNGRSETSVKWELMRLKDCGLILIDRKALLVALCKQTKLGLGTAEKLVNVVFGKEAEAMVAAPANVLPFPMLIQKMPAGVN